MTFQLPIMEEKVKPHQVTGLHLLSAFVIGGIGAFFYLLYDNIKYIGATMMALAVALLVLSLAKNKWLTRPGNTRALRVVELVVALFAAGYLASIHKWVPTIVPGSLCVALLYALYWERGTDNRLIILVSGAGIKLPITSRKRHIKWHEVEQVLLRHGILTVDCYNNRLFQYQVVPDGIDKEGFEAYCKGMVAENIGKRVEEW
jgi:hypothetical protein